MSRRRRHRGPWRLCLSPVLLWVVALPATARPAATAPQAAEAGDPAWALGQIADSLGGTGTPRADEAPERRRLASRLRIEGEAGDVPAALVLLADPDALVRRPLLEFIARDDLGAALGVERAAALARAAREDPEDELRTFAVEALGRLEHPAAAAELVQLLDALPPAEAERAAQALGATPEGRARIRTIVPERCADPRAFSEGVLARLLVHYGRALAEDPEGGLLAAERAPFVWGGRHPSSVVRDGAGLGLENLIARLHMLGQEQRCLELLGRLGGEGLDELLLDYRLAWIQLTRGSRPESAEAAARHLSARVAGRGDLEGRRWQFYGLYTEAAALFASGRGSEAEPLLAAADRVVTGLVAERVDLRPRLVTRSKAWSALSADYALLRGLVELMRLTIDLSEGRQADDPAVLSRARLVHELSLRAQLAAWQSRFQLSRLGLDTLFDHELSPLRLVLDNASNPHWTRGAALDLQLALGRALATVASEELPGFEPFTGLAPELVDPLADEGRRALLIALVQERLSALAEEREELRRREPVDQRQFFFLRARQRQLEQLLAEGEENGWHRLYEQRSPSDMALDLVTDLRAEARADEAYLLAERLLEDYRGLEHAMRQGGDWTLVRIELAVGGALTDAGRPAEAEERLLAALDRLEAFESTLEGQLVDNRDDPELVALIESDLRLTRAQRADALVSLAVNANVQMGDPERALAYFERAFELAPTEFNRVLLACYRARGGKRQEALGQIRRVVVGPTVYYNLACTYALLGETDLALEYLRREFDENLATEGQRRRQAGWAWKDPDLENLKQDGRFAEIAGPRPGE